MIWLHRMSLNGARIWKRSSSLKVLLPLSGLALGLSVYSASQPRVQCQSQIQKVPILPPKIQSPPSYKSLFEKLWIYLKRDRLLLGTVRAL